MSHLEYETSKNKASVYIDGIELPNPLNTERGTTRGARMGHAARHKKIRRDVALHVLSCIGVKRALGPPTRVHLVRVGAGPIEIDGLWASLKHVIDGVADAFSVDDKVLQGRLSVEAEKSSPGVKGLRIKMEWDNAT